MEQTKEQIEAVLGYRETDEPCLYPYCVLFREKGSCVMEDPMVFACMAECLDHAEEQCENAYPGCEVVWVTEN